MKPTKFAVKANVFTAKKRTKELNGPWKATPEEAIAAFGEKFSGFVSFFQVFVAETAPEETAPAADVRGVYYKTAKVEFLPKKFVDAGIHVGSFAPGAL